jgi:hypothetical protein
MNGSHDPETPSEAFSDDEPAEPVLMSEQREDEM